jgi:hypothetical protein
MTAGATACPMFEFRVHARQRSDHVIPATQANARGEAFSLTRQALIGRSAPAVH